MKLRRSLTEFLKVKGGRVDLKIFADRLGYPSEVARAVAERLGYPVTNLVNLVEDGTNGAMVFSESVCVELPGLGTDRLA